VLGVGSIFTTILTLVLFATYIGIGALAHDTGFSLGWAMASTAFVWAGPAQIILLSTLGSGATVVQAAVAVGVSAIRLFPMVVSILPMLRTAQTRRRISLRSRCGWNAFACCRMCRANGGSPSPTGSAPAWSRCR
jgi:predicted branched-subunit amino acid permease